MTPTPLRAALYARISEDMTGEAAGVERQLHDARVLATARGWEVVADFSDNSISALNGRHRPGYEDLMAQARGRKLDRIVVFHSLDSGVIAASGQGTSTHWRRCAWASSP